MGDRERDHERSRRDSSRRDDDRPRESKRGRSESESGTPDWLRKRREKVTSGDTPRIPRGGDGHGGKGYEGGDRFGGGGKGGGGCQGEIRPGDWSCSSCGMNNFARRTECFKCGTPKPSEKEPARYGGGGDRDRYRGGGRSRSRGRSPRGYRSRSRDRRRY
mmetsp:Transcript_42120/g.80572  ORF Transcript_42120/g.80572 Transcript_42120/m.80572 type:complete len:161 (+) Transcript_42120:59-541(+)